MPVPIHLAKLASRSQMWEALVLSHATVPVASRRMQVSLSDAKAGLAFAARTLRERAENCRNAEAVLKQSGAVKGELPRRAWDDVALGLRRV